MDNAKCEASDLRPSTSIGKRKRVSLSKNLSASKRKALVSELEMELDALFGYHRELGSGICIGLNECGTREAAIAAVMEESKLPLDSLVEQVFNKLRTEMVVPVGPVTMVSVKNTIIHIGVRMAYGVPNDEVYVLEDNTESCFWRWETRDVKLFPQSVRGKIILQRIRRSMIHHRIVAVSEMISLLKKPEQNCTSLNKAWKVLARVTKEEGIRKLTQDLEQKISLDVDEKKAKREEKLLHNRLDKSRKAVQGVKESMHSEIQGKHCSVKKPATLEEELVEEQEEELAEELEEEDPGESLTNCEAEEEEDLELDDEESDDGFIVPHGYLSADEGVQGPENSSPEGIEGIDDAECEEFRTLFEQQLHLNNLTENALAKEQPLIITNFEHQTEMDCPPTQEQSVLRALKMRVIPGGKPVDIPVVHVEDED